MRRVRQHLIRIYEQERGYGLYVGDPSSGLIRHALDHESEKVAPSYLLAQKRLDDVLDTKRVPWSMTFRRDGPRSFPLAAYGSYLELNAEHEPKGVFFLHAVELDDPCFLYPCVNGVVTFLSNTGIRELRRLVLNVAKGKANSGEAVKQIAGKLDGFIAASPPNPQWKGNDRLRIKSVEHDCAGAASVAWLSLALQQAKAIPPWEVYDEIQEGGPVITVATGAYDEGRRASDIQRQSLWQYFSVPIEVVTPPQKQPAPEQPVNVKLNEPASDHPLQAASAVTEQVQITDQPKDIKSRWVKILALAPFLPGLLIACVGISFIYNSNRQHKELLDVLNRIAGPANNKTASSNESKAVAERETNDSRDITSQGNQSALQTAQPTPQEQQISNQLRQTITNLFSTNVATRNNAIIQLRRDTKSHEAMVPFALQYASQNKADDDGVENTLMVFQRVDPATLKKHRAELLSFIEDVKNKNEKIGGAAEKVRLVVESP